MALSSRAACLLARCNAFALPCFACSECMHSTLALSSRAVCLLARCNAFALPKFCMFGVHAQHCGSLEPCCVPAGTVQCSCIAKFCMLGCMHSTMALSSCAVCLLALCKAFALPSF